MLAKRKSSKGGGTLENEEENQTGEQTLKIIFFSLKYIEWHILWLFEKQLVWGD